MFAYHIFVFSFSSYTKYPFLTYVISYISVFIRLSQCIILAHKVNIRRHFLNIKKHFSAWTLWLLYSQQDLFRIHMITSTLRGGEGGPQNSFLGRIPKTWFITQLNLLWLKNIPALNASIYQVLANRWLASWFPHWKYEENSKSTLFGG